VNPPSLALRRKRLTIAPGRWARSNVVTAGPGARGRCTCPPLASGDGSAEGSAGHRRPNGPHFDRDFKPSPRPHGAAAGGKIGPGTDGGRWTADWERLGDDQATPDTTGPQTRVNGPPPGPKLRPRGPGCQQLPRRGYRGPANSSTSLRVCRSCCTRGGQAFERKGGRRAAGQACSDGGATGLSRRLTAANPWQPIAVRRGPRAEPSPNVAGGQASGPRSSALKRRS